MERPSPESIHGILKQQGYMICTLSKHDAESQGYTDSLMLDHEGKIAEATGANIFKDKDGTYTHQFLIHFLMELLGELLLI